MENMKKLDAMLVRVPTVDGKGWMTFDASVPNSRLDAYLKKAKLKLRASRKSLASSQSNSPSAKS